MAKLKTIIRAPRHDSALIGSSYTSIQRGFQMKKIAKLIAALLILLIKSPHWRDFHHNAQWPNVPSQQLSNNESQLAILIVTTTEFHRICYW